VFVEEEEDEMEEMERMAELGDVGYMDASPFGGGRMRTHTGSTMDSVASSGPSVVPSTAYTTPDPNVGMSSPAPGMNGNGPGSTTTPTTSAPLTPVVAMPTGDSEAQIGLAKVAEPDVDAFMTYAAIVPEYCRLEGMLVKSLV